MMKNLKSKLMTSVILAVLLISSVFIGISNANAKEIQTSNSNEIIPVFDVSSTYYSAKSDGNILNISRFGKCGPDKWSLDLNTFKIIASISIGGPKPIISEIEFNCSEKYYAAIEQVDSVLENLYDETKNENVAKALEKVKAIMELAKNYNP